ncbi:hypothetical protein ACH5RR_015117 [Cinchona calisaya]|uniref:Pectinesterase inhibitor domain-containing protein n=1 Tax=Cinchona calisaya TaxID=153742 RepID=A0ABD2ZSN1_9GENT
MVSKTSLLLCVAIFMTLFISSSPTTYAENADSSGVEATKPAPRPTEPYKYVDEFCKKSRTRGFCKRVLKSDPWSASANNSVDLLFISGDLAVSYANKTKEYMAYLLKSNATKPELISILKHCISKYDRGISELLTMPKELVYDPALPSYDALLGSDALKDCGNALKSGEMVDKSILSIHKTATAYVWLCVDIAMTIS